MVRRGSRREEIGKEESVSAEAGLAGISEGAKRDGAVVKLLGEVGGEEERALEKGGV